MRAAASPQPRPVVSAVRRRAKCRDGTAVLCLMTAVAGSTVASCMVGPNYHAPPTSMPTEFHPTATSQGSNESAAARPIDPMHWWTSLDDPVLDNLIARATEANLDLGIAAARVAEARAARDIAEAGPWPIVKAIGGSPPGSGRAPLYGHVSSTIDRVKTEVGDPRGSLYERQAVGQSGLQPLETEITPPGRYASTYRFTPTKPGQLPTILAKRPIFLPKPRTTLGGLDQITYQAGFDAAWELDVFGGLRRAIEAADAELEAAIEARRDVQVIVIAEVARNFVELRGLQQRLEIAHRNIDRQARTVELVGKRFRSGLTNELDVALSKRQLASTQSRVPQIEGRIARAEHRLAVLTGAAPDALYPQLSAPHAIPSPPPDVPPGLPSELLRRRPDIRRAERTLEAATARIGVATADLYPHFYLTGTFGMQTADIRQLLNANSLVWGAGPGISWPIIDFGRIVGNIHLQEARASGDLLAYEKTVLTSLQEVDDALASYRSERERFERLQSAMAESTKAVRYATARYEKGLNDFLNVLDAERELYDIADEAASSEQAVALQFVALYKALGGGWQSSNPPAAQMVGEQIAEHATH